MKPIIFSTKMVQAIIEGRKTQTRRIIHVHGTDAFCGLKDNLGYPASDNKTWAGFGDREDPIYYPCPYGKVADTLWVRETHYRWAGCNKAPSDWTRSPDMSTYQERGYLGIKEHDELFCNYAAAVKIPSIHMPRWAARLFLRVVGIRVERLQDITTEDAEQEGVIARGCAFPRKGNIAIDTFADLWDSINFKRGSWDSNPWVWVIEFKKADLGVAE